MTQQNNIRKLSWTADPLSSLCAVLNVDISYCVHALYSEMPLSLSCRNSN